MCCTVRRLIEAGGTERERETEYSYDPDGRLRYEIRRLADGNTVMTEMQYDEDGRLWKRLDPSGRQTIYTYSPDTGNVHTLQTAAGQWAYGYDAEGRLTSITDPFGHTSEREYDDQGNVWQVTQDGDVVQTYTYNENNLLMARTDRDGQSYTFDYNADGQLIRQTDPTGVETRYAYDAEGRLWNTIDGSGNEILREYGGQSDSSSGSCTSCSASLSACSEQRSGANRLARIIYPTFSKELVYNDQGRVQEERYTPDGGEPSSVAYEYDPVSGQLLSVTGPDGHTSAYEYDVLGRRTLVTDVTGQTRFEYGLWDELEALVDANGQRTQFEYDEAGRLAREIRPGLQETSYTYYPSTGVGAASGRLQQTRDANQQTTDYEYDSQGRLWKIHRSASVSGVPASSVTLSYALTATWPAMTTAKPPPPTSMTH